jgi:hypothetical protein
MIKRDEFIQRLKGDIERLNAHLGQWQAKARAAGADARTRYDRQIAVLGERRERALIKLREVQSSSAGAWQDVAGGANAAWKQMRQAFEQAKARFEREPPR